ncbi:Proliferating cellular nuclear antigen 1 [Dictyocoela muelleri]|nr:Proliferating cellular nuclear antigen 1 [Dictyocoela muelleri]
MFELKIIESKDFQDRINILRRTLESVAEMVDDGEIKISESGFSIQVMDTMHVALADIFLSYEIFDEYRADRNITVGLKMKELLKIFKNIKFDEITSFSMSCEDDAQVLNIVVEAEEYSLRFEQKLFQFDIENYAFPELEYSVTLSMTSNDFFRIPKAVGSFSEHLIIHAMHDEVHFKAKGDLTDSDMTLRTINTGNSNIVIDVSSEVKKEVAMRYINSISKGAQLSDNVKICMGDNTPVYFEFVMKNGFLKYFIAPKVEN